MEPPDPAAVVPNGALLIGGRWVDRPSGGRAEHIDPATGKPLASFALAGAREIDEAVAAARAAFDGWRAWPAQQRRTVLWRIGTLLQEHALEHNTLRAYESGSPFKPPAPGGRWLASEYFHYYAGWVDKLHGETPPAYSTRALDYTLPEPYGVVAILVPWNAPVVSAAMKVAPALAAGNCVVLKPSELGALTPQLFARLCLEAGLPPGVLNVVAGGPEAGEALVAHPGVAKISFTGGGGTARKVLDAAARNLTPVLLELGGKSANIVFPDADLEAAAAMALQTGIVTGAGQACSLPTRLLVHDDVYADVVERVVGRAGAIRLGRPFDPQSQMGPVISEGSMQRILGIVSDAVSQTAGRLLTGGERAGGDLADGFFVPPTVFGEVDPASPLAKEEVFGPVLAAIRFRDEEEAISIANDTTYGLAGYVWTNDLKRAHRVAAALEAGYIGINGFPPMPANAPFGGYKGSGFGREGGLEGIREFVRTKNVYLDMS